MTASSDVRRVVDAVWRMESARVVGALTRLLRDVGLAEDVAQDALVAALDRWPESGVPDNPGAWLMTTARNRALDLVRRDATGQRKLALVATDVGGQPLDGGIDAIVDEHVEDDVLRLMLVACHPVLAPQARAALTLRLVGGLTTAEIARAYLTTEPTIAQRIVRAKRTLKEAGVPYEVPVGAERTARLASVLEVLYLLYNEGYSASAGDDLLRPTLCREALRLGRSLAALAPDEPEVHGLQALMELHSSRLATRVSSTGNPVLLPDQDRSRWDRLLIRRGQDALERARLRTPFGPYTLQASIAACHAVAPSTDETDWVRVAALYDALSRVAPSPVVELNRAVAVGMAFGPEAGLELVDQIVDDPAMRRYHLVPAVRADLLLRVGRTAEARGELLRAAELTANNRERAQLLVRAGSLA